MPGIVGLVTDLPRARAHAELVRMLATVRHEPFYSIRMWSDEASGVYVGWSARDEEARVCEDITGNVVVVLSGELTPEPRADEIAERAGQDADFPATLNGRFHGITVNRRSGTATIFNDRYGMHRLYYHRAKGTIYFAAEAKAILAVRPELRSVDPGSMGELIACGCVLENRTLFNRIYVLPAGAAWKLRRGAVEATRQYFDPREWETQPVLSEQAYYEQLRSVFAQTLPRYFEGHAPVAMSLTGGLDTRMVMAWQRLPAGSLPSYTFGGTFRDCADVRVARQVAALCEQPHQVITVGDDFLSRFETYAERTVYLTDGCADVSRAADLYVNQQARKIASARMTGNYGGEVLRRVRAFKPVEPLPGLFRPDLMSYVRQARHTYAHVVHAHPLSFAVFRQAPWHHYGLLALEQTQLSVRSPFLDNDFVRTVYRAPASTLTSNDVCLRLIADGRPALRAIPTDRDGRPSQFTYKAEYAYDYGMPQWLASIDRLLTRLKPERLFLGRHKFYHFRVWYRDALSRYVRDMLLDPSTLSRPYLDRKHVEQLVTNHVKGSGNYTVEIHKLLTLELVQRLFVDRHAYSHAPAAAHA